MIKFIIDNYGMQDDIFEVLIPAKTTGQIHSRVYNLKLTVNKELKNKTQSTSTFDDSPLSLDEEKEMRLLIEKGADLSQLSQFFPQQRLQKLLQWAKGYF
jgi:hypothetical protein